MRATKNIGFANVLVALTVALGCHSASYELAPVRGTVTIEGQPLSQFKVMFAPVEVDANLNPGKPAFGLVQADGSFVLTTYKENDGAVVGEHWVTIISLRKKAAATFVSNTSRQATQFSRISLPQKVNVIAGQENHFELRLTRQDVARYGVQLDD